MEWKIIRCLKYIATWCVVYLVFALMWVGAEYVFEGAVHSSHVDGVVNAWLTSLVVKVIEG